MPDIKNFRREWNSNQKLLRELLKNGQDLEKARDVFFKQHAVLHSQRMSGLDGWSYADEIFIGLSDDVYRTTHEGQSLIWILWHISRIEDITMNILVAGGDQVYDRGGWKDKLNAPVNHTGNEGSQSDLDGISASLSPMTLLEYRDAVGRATRDVFNNVPAVEWYYKVQPARLTRLVEDGAVLPQATGLLNYWGNRKIFELYLMPPTRHLMVHLNEAYDLRKIIERKINSG